MNENPGPGPRTEKPSGGERVRSLLAEQGWLILDGGLASELEVRGCDLGDELWSARLLVDGPELLSQVHADYLEAGADCIVSASYQATVQGFVRRGLSARQAVTLLRHSVELACQARDAFWSAHGPRGDRRYPLVAASIGPYGACLADGSEYRGDYTLSADELADFHRDRLTLLAGVGADLVAFETIPSAIEARVLARLLRELPGTDAWISFTLRDVATLSDGTPLATVAAELDGEEQIFAIGVNCLPPRWVDGALAVLRRATGKPLAVYPNSGESWDAAARCWRPAAVQPDLATLAPAWYAGGARLLGGCCRTGPDDIRRLRQALVAGKVEGQGGGP